MTLRLGNAAEVGMSAERMERLAQRARGWVEAGEVTALVVLAARRGIIVLHEAFGKLTPEPGAPPLPRDAIFPLASISKVITATAVMILMEEGLLGLNRPVAEYIPEFIGPGKQRVMVHHLLTHTSGIDDKSLGEYLRRKAGEEDMPVSDEPHHPLHDLAPFLRFVADAHAAPLATPPGEEMSYCNYGYFLLGDIVERVSGQSLAAFAKARIFDRLGMKDTSFGLSSLDASRVVRRLPDAKGTHLLQSPDLPQAWLAFGGAFSTAYDIATLCQMLLNRGCIGSVRLLSPASVAEMTRNQIPGIPARYKTERFGEGTWGLGPGVKGEKKALRHATLGSASTFSHGGAGGTYWWVDPAYDLVGVYFSVNPHYYPDMMEQWNADLFANAVTAAVEHPDL